MPQSVLILLPANHRGQARIDTETEAGPQNCGMAGLGPGPAFTLSHGHTRIVQYNFSKQDASSKEKRCLSTWSMTFVLEMKIDRGNGDNHIPPRHKCCSFASRAF
jgi:hypothetical protein